MNPSRRSGRGRCAGRGLASSYPWYPIVCGRVLRDSHDHRGRRAAHGLSRHGHDHNHRATHGGRGYGCGYGCGCGCGYGCGYGCGCGCGYGYGCGYDDEEGTTSADE